MSYGGDILRVGKVGDTTCSFLPRIQQLLCTLKNIQRKVCNSPPQNEIASCNFGLERKLLCTRLFYQDSAISFSWAFPLRLPPCTI